MKLKSRDREYFGKTKNYLTWFGFWHPGKDAALRAEKDYNEKVFEENRKQDELEAGTTLQLTQLDNKKTILIIFLVIIGVVIIYR